MGKRVRRVIGVLSLLLGVILLLNASRGITGFVIAEHIGVGASSTLGLIFVIVSIVLLSYRESDAYEARTSRLQELVGERYKHLSKDEKTSYNKSYRRHLEKQERRRQQEGIHEEHVPSLDIIRTKHFERAIRGHNEKAIERAIQKIGTGLGKEERLKHLPGYAIRVSKGGRLRYDKRDDGTIELLDYLPSHTYSHRHPK